MNLKITLINPKTKSQVKGLIALYVCKHLSDTNTEIIKPTSVTNAIYYNAVSVHAGHALVIKPKVASQSLRRDTTTNEEIIINITNIIQHYLCVKLKPGTSDLYFHPHLNSIYCIKFKSYINKTIPSKRRLIIKNVYKNRKANNSNTCPRRCCSGQL